MTFLLNPKRTPSLFRRWVCRLGTNLGFLNVDYTYLHGAYDQDRLTIGQRVSLGMNTTLNVNSGTIYIGDDTIFGHHCMVVTGVHRFVDGKRAKLSSTMVETPSAGYDIIIGKGVFVGSGAIIIGKVTIGDHCLIAAGSVVTHDVPSGAMVAGNPARVIKFWKPPHDSHSD